MRISLLRRVGGGRTWSAIISSGIRSLESSSKSLGQPLGRPGCALFLSPHATVFSLQLPGRWGTLAGDGVHGRRHVVRRARGSVPRGRTDRRCLSGGEGSRLCFPWPAQDGPCKLVVKNSRAFLLTALFWCCCHNTGKKERLKRTAGQRPRTSWALFSHSYTPSLCSGARARPLALFHLLPLPSFASQPLPGACLRVLRLPRPSKPACRWQNFKLRAKEMPAASTGSIAAQTALESGTGLTRCFLLCCHKATDKVFAAPPPSQRAGATCPREEGLLEAQMCLRSGRRNTRKSVEAASSSS